VIEPPGAELNWGRLADLGNAGVLDPSDGAATKNGLIDRAHKRALTRYGGGFRGLNVLDFGCGNGRISEWLVAGGANVHGVDATPEMVAAARSRVPGARFDVLDDVDELRPGTYDAVVSVYVLAHVPREELGRVLSGLRTALVPGGRLVCLEKVGAGTLDAGWRSEDYRQAVDTAGFQLHRAEVVRLGYSRLIGVTSRRPLLARMPVVPYLLRREASANLQQRYEDGQYADFLFVASERGDSRPPRMASG
jgi:SAM-dependent methyltransferase